MNYKKFYRIGELRELGIGGRTFSYKLLAEGRLVALKNGRATLVTGESVRAYLESLPVAEIGRKAA